MRLLPTASWHLAGAVLAAVAAAGATPGSAVAAALFAAATGTPAAACTAADPCDLSRAVRAAAPGDDVTVLPGTYDLTGKPTVSIRSDIVVHGAPGQPRPVVVGDNRAGVLQVESAGAVVRHMAIEGVIAVTQGLRLARGSAENVFVHVSAPRADACDVDGGLLRNSVCWADGAARGGLHMHAAVADLAARVTGSTIAGPVGIRVKVLPGRVGALTVDSSIVLSTTGGPDIETKEFGDRRVVLSSCNFDSAVGRGITATGTQTAPPLLADPARGDFHQLPGSPTVDAGSAAPGDRGAFDVDGDARVIGPAVDIGADELAALASPPAPAAAHAPRPASAAPAALQAPQRPPAVWGVALGPRSVRAGAPLPRVRFVVDGETLVRIRVRAVRGGRQVAAVLVRVRPGANNVTLSRRRRLEPGRYRVTVRPQGGVSVTRTFSVSSAPRRSRAGAR